MNRTSTIWKTVVFAGAMLGSACGGSKKAPEQPKPDVATKPAADDPCADKKNPDDPCADPCANPDADPCAWTDPCEGGGGEIEGRGFILS